MIKNYTPNFISPPKIPLEKKCNYIYFINTKYFEKFKITNLNLNKIYHGIICKIYIMNI